MAEEIEIEISPAGKVTVRTLGIKGPKCVNIAEAVARIVGQIQSQERTSEYYEAEGHITSQVEVRARR